MNFEILERYGRLTYVDHFEVRAPDPIPMRSADGKTFEVFGFDFEFMLFPEGWILVEATVSGPVMLEDGMYGETVEVVYGDPIHHDDSERRAPGWIQKLAAERAKRIDLAQLAAGMADKAPQK